MSAILIIEDDELVRDHLHDTLNHLGFDVECLPNGLGAEEAAARLKPVACFIDLVMDQREGVETLIGLKTSAPSLPLVAISSHPHYLQMIDGLGATKMLQKPITPEMATETLRDLGLLD